MGNSGSKSISDISGSFMSIACRIKSENNFFLSEDNSSNFDKNHVNGGISSGTSSSSKYTYPNGDEIEIWYDITLVNLLRGRNQLLKEWLQSLNQLKKTTPRKTVNPNLIFSSEKQKSAYMKRFEVCEEDASSLELKYLTVIPRDVKYRDKGKYISQKINEFLAKHGFRGNRDIKNSLLDLVKRPEGRCTSGFLTFLEVLDEENQLVISNSDPNKEFHIKIQLSYCDPQQQQLYESARDKIEEEIRKEMIYPIKLSITEDMKPGSVISVQYKWYNSRQKKELLADQTIENPEIDGLNIESFEWTIPENFLDGHKVGDTVDFPEDKLPFDIYLKFNNICYQENKKEFRKLRKPFNLKEFYTFSFNLEDKDLFQNFIKESLDRFHTLKKEAIKSKKFEGYQVYL